jgi:outer membrane protein assembly factor BamD (BamD/ComL family)
MVYIYRDRVGDQALSDEAFRDFCKRFPSHELLVDLYYMQYLTALKTNDMNAAEQYRQDIMRLFPGTNEAYIVSQPDYFNKLRRMSVEQDSLYEQTYTAFRKNEYKQVKTNKTYAEENYPLSPLMPRFLFLNAIAVAKTDGQDAFVLQLQDMVSRYPESELSSMAKDMLALMGQGAESQVGDLSSLQTKRSTEPAQEVVDSLEVSFDATRNTPAMMLLVINQDEQQLNQLLYDVALFNFSQFMIKDFDLKQELNFTKNQSAVIVSGFEKMDEAEWYHNLLTKNPEIGQKIITDHIQVVCITQTNYEILNKHFSLPDYLQWLKTNK